MRKGALALYLLLLTFASHGIPCAAAATSAMAEEDAAHRHHLRPHHDQHETQGERVQTARKVGRMAGGSGEGSSRNNGGGAANTGPHNTKNGGTVALPSAATSALALVFTATVLLSALSF